MLALTNIDGQTVVEETETAQSLPVNNVEKKEINLDDFMKGSETDHMSIASDAD